MAFCRWVLPIDPKTAGQPSGTIANTITDRSTGHLWSPALHAVRSTFHQ